ncbi:MAG: leucine-rich repeat domain-containing protein [Paludibacteraceae bacterium]|nr:leucine-rich repeat domain-containing protein [Paludibacteraceae bacterium]
MKKIYSFLAALLMLVGMMHSQQAYAEDVRISILAQPEWLAYSVEISTPNGWFSGEAEVAQGTNVTIVGHQNGEWQFVSFLDETGNVYSTQDTVQLVATEDITLRANYRYSPFNPGYVPHGYFDASTGTAHVELMMADREFSDLSRQVSAVLRLNEVSREQVTGIHLFGQANWLDLWTLAPYNYPNLHSLDLGDMEGEFHDINSWQFEGWNLFSVVLPASINYIGEQAFLGNSNLTTLQLKSPVPPEAQNIFLGIETDNLTIIVPAASLNDYMSDSFWSDYTLVPDQVQESKTITVSLTNSMYEGCSLTLTTADGRTITREVVAGTTSYVFTVYSGAEYTLSVTAPQGEVLYNESFLLEDDLTLPLDNAIHASKATIRVAKGNDDITDQCIISWETTGEPKIVYGVGNVSPLMADNDVVLIHITPMAPLDSYFYEKDTIVIMGGQQPIYTWLEARPENQVAAGREPAGTLHAYTYERSNAVGIILDSELTSVLARYSFAYNEQQQQSEFYAFNLAPGQYNLVTIDEKHPYATSQLTEFLGEAANDNEANIWEFNITDQETTHLDVEIIPEYTETPNPEEGVVEAGLQLARNQVLIADINTLTMHVDLRESPRALQSDVLSYYLVVPKELEVVPGSVMIGLAAPVETETHVLNETSNILIYHASQLTNKADVDATRLRLSFQINKKGNYTIGGMVTPYQGAQLMVSGTDLAVNSITMEAPENLVYLEGDELMAEVQGMGPVASDIIVRDRNGNTIGTARSNGWGNWNTIVRVDSPEDVERWTAVAENHSVIITTDTSYVNVERVSASEVATPIDFGFTHFNNWYKRPMPVRWHTDDCAADVNYYYYYHSEEFTFTANFEGTPDSVAFVLTGQNGTITRVFAAPFVLTRDGSTWLCVKDVPTSRMPINMTIEYYVRGIRLLYTPCSGVRAIADPSGYIYEAVTSNRVEGVTATIYTKENESAPETLWDAAFYDQENPQVTDFAGRYGWDVPMGLWQVRFAKDGFEPLETEWLPVPPPQMEINRPMVRMSAPQLESVQAYDDSIVLTFDRYMIPSYMTTDNISITEKGTGAAPISGHITLLDEESRTPGDDVTYVRRVAYKADRAFGTTQVSVAIANGVLYSYAGVAMGAFQQDVEHTMAVNSMSADAIHVQAGQSVDATITLLPAAAAEGMTVQADNMGSAICSVSATQTVSAAGVASVHVTGNVAGTTQIRLALQGTDLEQYVTVVVSPAPAPLTPTAIEDIPAFDEKQPRAEKLLKDGSLIIISNGIRYNALGQQLGK